MSESRVSKNLRWTRVRSVGAAARVAPRLAGVYAYAEAKTLHGLPVDLSWVYVGKALNLASRLDDHDAERESSPLLRDWLHRRRQQGEVWYAVVPPEYLDVIERDAIVTLQPRLNRVRYRSHKLSIPACRNQRSVRTFPHTDF